MPSRPSHSLTDIVLALADGGVEFILVDGFAAVAQGATMTTFDVASSTAAARTTSTGCSPCSPAWMPIYRGRPGGERLPPNRTALAGPGHSLFRTSLGPLDVLGEIEGHRSHAQLIDDTESVSFAGRVVRVLSLEMIVQLKRASSHPKDVRALPILEAALARAKR